MSSGDSVTSGGGVSRAPEVPGGAELARRYHDDVVGPILAAEGIAWAGARLGSGSDVLGFDDATSRDHDWGLRLTVVVAEDDVAGVDRLLADRLPATWAGQPTRFPVTWDPQPRHRVEVLTAHDLATARLGLDPRPVLDPRPGSDPRPGLAPWQWLGLTGQSVLEVVAGPVFHDGPGELAALRAAVAGYPDDVRRYVVASAWAHLGQELPFVGRCGSRDDELGSAVVAGRLARVLMHLGHVLEGRWAPYGKWLGTSFAGLPGSASAAGDLRGALTATTWREREARLVAATDRLLDVQRATGLPAPEHATEAFHDRPFRGVTGVPEVVAAGVTDTAVRALPHGVGAVEQWVDDVHVLMDPARRLAVARAALAP
ncbi:DUF4037 domain-containing protein [Luteimicrobium subarcticum]|uniref:DUF4037 domain-containing protein n=1 Tax=Luteimicrobium subarcticum TaxID=620910 RepID=UPI001FEA0002|nr:DUF4037 domain-containing protein [Luteimicrobium subarcticum]